MWRGHEAALKAYYNAVRAEWIARGYKNTMPPLEGEPWSVPAWIDDDLIRSHRSNLLRKDPVWVWPVRMENVPDNLPYVWPKGIGNLTITIQCRPSSMGWPEWNFVFQVGSRPNFLRIWLAQGALACKTRSRAD